MKFENCISKAVELGAMSQEDAIALRTDAEVASNRLAAQGVCSKEQAELMGAKEALEHRKMVETRNKYQKVLQARANKQNLESLAAHPDSMAKGLASLLVKDLKNHRGETPWSNVDNRAKAIEGTAHSLAADMLRHLHTTHLGLRQDNQTMLDTVREAFGESTGNSKAASAAKAWLKAAEFLRERFNRAGGFIPKRENWGMSQVHDQKKVAKASKEQWINYVLPLLNREAMVNMEGRIMTDQELMEALSEAYTTIASGGNNKRTAGQQGGSKLANRHQDGRWMVFKDADSWIEYQQKYGEPEIFNVMTGHLRRMSSEIAMLEVLGPNPEHAFKMLKDTINIEGEDANMGLIDAYYDVVSGKADTIAQNRTNVAQRAAAVRHVMMSAQLGGAALSAITDPIYGRTTRKFNGIPAVKMLQRTLAQLDPTNEKDRAFAAHIGLTMDGWAQQALAGARFAGDADPAGKASKLSEFVFRASGLSSWTSAQRQAFGLDFSWHLANQVNKPLSAVDEKFQAMLRRYGIDEDDWSVIQQAKLERHGEASYFRAQNIYDLDVSADVADRVVTKIQEAIHTEMDFATPTPDARVRALTTWGGHSRGTFAGEVSRMAMMYKSFSITQFTTHMNRGGLAYPVILGIKLMALGAVALQMKEVSKGREPQDMTNMNFWVAAGLQGGGLGIFGDFFTTMDGANRYGNSLLATAAGPGGSLIEDVFDLGAEGYNAVIGLATGEESSFGSEFVGFMKRYTPGHTLWHSRLVFERALWDNLEEIVDEDVQDNWRKYEKKLETEKGQGYWWKRGESAPQF